MPTELLLLLPELADLVHKQGRVSPSDLNLLLIGHGLDDQQMSREAERWVKILEIVRNDPKPATVELARAAFARRGVPADQADQALKLVAAQKQEEQPSASSEPQAANRACLYCSGSVEEYEYENPDKVWCSSCNVGFAIVAGQVRATPVHVVCPLCRTSLVAPTWGDLKCPVCTKPFEAYADNSIDEDPINIVCPLCDQLRDVTVLAPQSEHDGVNVKCLTCRCEFEICYDGNVSKFSGWGKCPHCKSAISLAEGLKCRKCSCEWGWPNGVSTLCLFSWCPKCEEETLWFPEDDDGDLFVCLTNECHCQLWIYNDSYQVTSPEGDEWEVTKTGDGEYDAECMDDDFDEEEDKDWDEMSEQEKKKEIEEIDDHLEERGKDELETCPKCREQFHWVRKYPADAFDGPQDFRCPHCNESLE